MNVIALGFLGIGEKWEEIKTSAESIADFCSGVTWCVTHPYGVFKIIMDGLCIIARFGSMVVCAAALLMYIFGNDKALKYVPTSIVIFLVLKVLVSVL
jgi:hypothetical protein